MANQIKVGGLYCSQKQSAYFSTICQFNVERERGKMEVANHLILVNCFTIEMLNDRQLSSDADYSTFFPQIQLFWEPARKRERERERENKCELSYLSLCISLSTNNEAVTFTSKSTREICSDSGFSIAILLIKGIDNKFLCECFCAQSPISVRQWKQRINIERWLNLLGIKWF